MEVKHEPLLKKATIELNKAQAQLDAAIRRANVDVKALLCR